MLSLILALSLSGQVTRIIDGDTFRARINERDETVRLSCIDAPEKKQDGGLESTLALSKLLPLGAEVRLDSVKGDRYGRLTAIVTEKTSNHSINLLQVASGHALIYPEYIKDCRTQKPEFEANQTKAQQSGLGFWSLPVQRQVFPWNWRKKY